jgi:hypothetical protein
VNCPLHGDLNEARIFENRCAACRAAEDLRANVQHAHHTRRPDLLRLARSVECGEIPISRNNFSVISKLIAGTSQPL